MNPVAYHEMYQTEHSHWWYLGRKSILSKVIKQLRLPEDAKILEVGCGTGGNLAMLSTFGQVSAFEIDEFAYEFACKNATEGQTIKRGPHLIISHSKNSNLISFVFLMS